MVLTARAPLLTSAASRTATRKPLVVAGSVVDFVDVYWRSYHFWAFNLADSAITIGVAAMILDMLGNETHASEAV